MAGDLREAFDRFEQSILSALHEYREAVLGGDAGADEFAASGLDVDLSGPFGAPPWAPGERELWIPGDQPDRPNQADADAFQAAIPEPTIAPPKACAETADHASHLWFEGDYVVPWDCPGVGPELLQAMCTNLDMHEPHRWQSDVGPRWCPGMPF